jgi:hypothetical protein
MASSRPLRLVVALWLAVGIAVSVRTVIRPDSHTIFPILADGVEHWWHDQPLYADYKPLDYFRYPPSFAVFLSPFGWLGLRLGGVVWTWLGLAVYGAGLWTFARRVLPVQWTDGRLAVYMTLGLFGGLRGLWNAQSNALIVGLLLLGSAAIVSRRWWSAAFLLAGATMIKVTPIAPALLLCALWPRALTPRFAVTLAVLAVAPFLTRPPDVVVNHYRDWGQHLTATSHERWPGFRDAYTVWQVGREYAAGVRGVPWLKEPLDSTVYRGLQLLTAFAALTWSQWVQRRAVSERESISRTLAVGMAWLMLFGPSSEHATYVFLAPVLCWAFLAAGQETWRRVLIGTAFALVMLLGWGSLTRPWLDALPVLLLALPLGTALFVVWLVPVSRGPKGVRSTPYEVGPFFVRYALHTSDRPSPLIS